MTTLEQAARQALEAGAAPLAYKYADAMLKARDEQ